MRIERTNIFLTISELHPSDYHLIVIMATAIHKLLSEYELDSITDNQKKEKLQSDLERIIKELSQEKGTKTAESYSETIIRKVIEKITS